MTCALPGSSCRVAGALDEGGDTSQDGGIASPRLMPEFVTSGGGGVGCTGMLWATATGVDAVVWEAEMDRCCGPLLPRAAQPSA